MSLPRLRLERCAFDNGLWHIDAEEAHHLIRVRRCYTGSLVEGLLDGEKIALKLECRGESVFAREMSRVREDVFSPRIELLLALLKNDQLDDALRFCAETGVREIHLLSCERSVPRYEGAKLADKTARWRKILDEATKQAGAATPPLLHEPVAFAAMDFGKLPPQRLAALLSPETRRLREIDIAPHVAIAVGPEGDWAPHESERLLAEGFIPISLGRRIMRASTAVAAACAAAAILCRDTR